MYLKRNKLLFFSSPLYVHGGKIVKSWKENFLKRRNFLMRFIESRWIEFLFQETFQIVKKKLFLEKLVERFESTDKVA